MAQLESIDGKKYNVPDDVLAKYRISEEDVGKLLQHDDLPVAPPPQEGWDNYGMTPQPTPPASQPSAQPLPAGIEALQHNPFVRMSRGPNNQLVINLVLPGAQ